MFSKGTVPIRMIVFRAKVHLLLRVPSDYLLITYVSDPHMIKISKIVNIITFFFIKGEKET